LSVFLISNDTQEYPQTLDELTKIIGRGFPPTVISTDCDKLSSAASGNSSYLLQLAVNEKFPQTTSLLY